MPAYAPVLVGVQAVEYRGVEVEILKTDIIVMDDCDEDDVEWLDWSMFLVSRPDRRYGCRISNGAKGLIA